MEEGDLLTYKGELLKLFGLDYTELVYVEAGSFIMGDNDKAITLYKGYYIGKYLVTQELYKEVMGAEPSRFKSKHRPVENVSHNDICKGSESFFSKLNVKLKLEYPDLKGDFALPSEAQWEYAARGGKEWDTPKLEYSGSQNINDVAWYVENSNNQTMPVGLKQPNALSIYDMSGNVREWCTDSYKEPKEGSVFTKKGSTIQVVRGGSYILNAEYCRVAFRLNPDPDYGSSSIGFRLVFSPSLRSDIY